MTDIEDTLEKLQAVQRGVAQDFLPDAEFISRYRDAKEWAMNYERDHNGLNMMLLCYMRHREDKDDWNQVPVMFSDWPPPEGKKRESMLGLGSMLADKFPDHMLLLVVQISEAWMASYGTEDVDKGGTVPDGIPMPSQRSDRTEILIIDATTMDQRKCTAMIPIVRKSNGDFGTYGVEHEELHDPADKKDPRDLRNFVVESVFHGNLMAAAKRRER